MSATSVDQNGDLRQFIDQYKYALRDDRSLSPNAKLLLCMLMLRYPRICPSHKTILADCGWKDERTLVKAKREALAAGWLAIEHQGTGPGDSTVYALKLPASDVGSSDEGSSGAEGNYPHSVQGELPTFCAGTTPIECGSKTPSKDSNEDDQGIDLLTGKDDLGEDSGLASRPMDTSRPRDGILPAPGVPAAEDRELVTSALKDGRIRFVNDLAWLRLPNDSVMLICDTTDRWGNRVRADKLISEAAPMLRKYYELAGIPG